MTNYITLPPNKKLNLLGDHSLGCDWPDLDQEQWCLHCRKKFNGHSVRVWRSEDNRLWLECGTPECDGSPIDWAPYPWWNPKHRETKAYLRKARANAKSRSKPKGSQNADGLERLAF